MGLGNCRAAVGWRDVARGSSFGAGAGDADFEGNVLWLPAGSGRTGAAECSIVTGGEMTGRGAPGCGFAGAAAGAPIGVLLLGAAIGRGAGLARGEALVIGADAGLLAGAGNGLPAGFAIGAALGFAVSGPLLALWIAMGAPMGLPMPGPALDGLLAGFPGRDGLLLSLVIRHTAP